MNKTAIKNYAIWARVQLIESAKQRAFEYGITENGENKPNVDTVGGRLLSAAEKEQRTQLIGQIRQKGFSQVMEEAAYTWFNRFIALRFMEVNGYLPSKVRVFTDENGAFKPEILKEAMSVELDELDRNKVLNLLDKQDNEALYKYLLITQCNALNTGLPYMFEKISNWTELLFPANLLRADSVIGRMVSDIAEDDFQEEVEIIGWLYQYYISEKHEEVIDPLHGKIIKKEDIPAATQLFTTDWVVRYILDNSLGRYWIERNPGSSLASKLTYLVTPKDGKIEAINERIAPEELKVLDPCVGSGHFLSYAFDILLEIYRECGWSDRDAAKSIIENNLYGLDIDDRATQLACFAVAMKARKYNRRILNGETVLNVVAMQDSDFITDDFIRYFANKNDALRKDIQELRTVFNNAKEYGSIISAPKLNYAALYERIDIIRRSFAEDIFQIEYQRITQELLLPLVKQAEILSKKYDVVVTNPPYMNKYSARLKDYIQQHFAAYKGDLFSVFMFRNFAFCKENGYSGFMTPNVWMFIKSYEELRTYIIGYKSIAALTQMAKGAFFKEATVDICAFVLTNKHSNRKGLYIRLEDFKGDMDVQNQKVLEALADKECGYLYETDATNFSKIPGSPVAYWVSESVPAIYSNNPTLEKIADVRHGLSTGKNELFVRRWEEVDWSKIDFSITNRTQIASSPAKWFPYNKGGDYRLWYGNADYVLWYNTDGQLKMASMSGHRHDGKDRYFQESISWSFISSSNFGVRYTPTGFAFDVAGSSMFLDNEIIKYITGLLCSCLGTFFMEIQNPTLNFQVGNLKNVPVIVKDKNRVDSIVNDAIKLSKGDWDSYETSWDFKRNPLAPSTQALREQMASQFATSRMEKFGQISWHYENWKQECEERFQQLKKNEEELNRIFIDIYGLQDELTPDVADKDVTVHRVFDSKDDVPESMKGSNYVRTMRDEIVSLISYAVGCMFGRYSLDVDGLAYAGGGWDASKYKTIIPYGDNIIPICDDEYFDDDITGRFVEFVRKVYGDDTLEENLKFIADALGGRGTPREVIRSYFINDFYADHLKIYQKRPIYWLFDSGKKNGFKALIYMHRYQPDLLARMRTDYVHEQQERYRTQLQILEDSLASAAPSERVKLNKQIAKLKDQSLEIQKYEEKIHHLADQMISIDLDDGVKVNYAKFQDVLEKIK